MNDPAERDRRLAAEAGGGDDAAFAELVGRHRRALVRAVGGRTSRPALAEDAVQEALLAAHRALRAGKRPTDVRAWLHTIAWRRAVDLVRREQEVAVLSDEMCGRAGEGPERRVAEADELRTVLRHWHGLPARQRRALALSVLEGRSLDEIAGALGVTRAGAKALVARSRRTLSAKLSASREPCDRVVPQIIAAVEDGARLPAEVRWHADACPDCARMHREARRRRRVRAALLWPAGLVERLRDLAVVGTSHEPQVSLVTKLCAGACAATLAGGSSVAVVAERGTDSPPERRTATADPGGERRERMRSRAPRAAAPVRVAVASPVRASAPKGVAPPAQAPVRVTRPTAAAPREQARPIARRVPPASRPGSVTPRRPTTRTEPARLSPAAPGSGQRAAEADPAAGPPGPPPSQPWVHDESTGLIVARRVSG
jgi:RNA polymerase sigma factor (sigma-70 family)